MVQKPSEKYAEDIRERTKEIIEIHRCHKQGIISHQQDTQKTSEGDTEAIRKINKRHLRDNK